MADIWKDIGGLEDPKIQMVGRRPLPHHHESLCRHNNEEVLLAYGQWKRWVHPARSFPVELPNFLLYLQDVGERTKSSAAVSEAINSVSWVQCLAGVEAVGQN